MDHFSRRQLREGNINATLRWQFDLTELNFRSLVILFDGTTVAGVINYKSLGSGPQPGFEKQFGIDWSLNQTSVKLVIFNVTVEENGRFTCQVYADAVEGYVYFRFESNVQVEVIGKLQVTFSNI